ncbi:DNA-directed RNA polymerase subunit beta [Streptococcus dysgalactiae]|uniref:DNA-directed RNA polymerase subunit beta n=1 Tax=Streptococcus dysgalactiae TaxID=1334 RepID=UPI000F70FBAF|nr:DNA-directed RNA polymerase subunit beta [Streptococcus dysgalactiae]MEE3741954.1 DNA-directed RNA polymerase subunit beta [Streptococcus dysgalactiae]VDZ40104.1 epuA protein [Streptococcus dysgalactiae subsp. dysgalactiae]
MTSGWRYVVRQLLLILGIALLACLFLAFGLIVGYSFMGDGGNPWSILSLDKWAELVNKFTGK